MRIDRLNAIEQHIFECNNASLDELAELFGVSKNTIRRDLKELLDRGRIKKVYGGVAINDTPTLLPMSVRSQSNMEAKRKIGALAAAQVEDGSCVFLDSGSTTLALLPHLAEKKDVTVVTHSLSALYEAAKYPSLNVIALGGMYCPETASYVGASTVQAICSTNVDTAFIAATGVSLDYGLSNSTYFEAEIKRSVVAHNRRNILLADNSKFDCHAAFSFCAFGQLFAVVTDLAPSQAYVERFKREDVKLFVAE